MLIFMMIALVITIWMLTMHQLMDRTNGKNKDRDHFDDIT